MPTGIAKPGASYSMIWPLVVIRPILLGFPSVNHSAPSGPAAISRTSRPGHEHAGTGNSVIVPSGVIRPIFDWSRSVNHTAPSGPGAIPSGKLNAVGVGNSVIVLALAIAGNESANPIATHTTPGARWPRPHRHPRITPPPHVRSQNRPRKHGRQTAPSHRGAYP
jgi:hypothetical protein